LDEHVGLPLRQPGALEPEETDDQQGVGAEPHRGQPRPGAIPPRRDAGTGEGEDGNAEGDEDPGVGPAGGHPGRARPPVEDEGAEVGLGRAKPPPGGSSSSGAGSWTWNRGPPLGPPSSRSSSATRTLSPTSATSGKTTSAAAASSSTSSPCSTAPTRAEALSAGERARAGWQPRHR